MYGAAISYATKKLQGPGGGSLLRSRYEERCVTSDDPNNGCGGD